MKVTWNNHTNIKGVIDIGVEKISYECNALVTNYHDMLEVGNKFDIGGYNLTLVRAKYNADNKGVYYVFENKKEAF